MKSIAYIVLYFGKFPNNFDIWLYTCKYNPSIDWIIFTDDKSNHNYPKNVKVNYISFDELRDRIQNCYDFEIVLEKPYKLCDFRVAYGEIFEKELKNYDYWGYCDIDLMWGDIRKFITDDILIEYEKIGFQGHSTIYKNTTEVNLRYRKLINNKDVLKNIFNTKESMFFDENIINKIYMENNIKFYSKVIFANISPLTYSFYLRYFPKNLDYKNKNQIFIWQSGKLFRLYCNNEKIYKEEFMYIHFLRREMKSKIDIDKIKKIDKMVIIPNKICEAPKIIDINYIKKNSKNKMLLYYIDLIRRKWRKISVRNVYNYFKHRRKSKKMRKIDNERII